MIEKSPLDGRKNLMVLSCGQGSSATNTAIYIPLFDSTAANNSATESATDHPFNFSFIVKRVQAVCAGNNKNATTTLAFRAGGVSVGTLTYTAAATGEVDSGELSVLVASGTKCNFIRDCSASASGSFQFLMYATIEIIG